MKFFSGKWKYLLGLMVMVAVSMYGIIPAASATAIPLRGIVEGFYGTPWSQTERLNMLQFAHDHKLNAYIYAPKDDPYHRAKWREPYPADKLANLQTLIDTAKKQQVKFIFAISPGLDIKFDGQQGEADKLAMEKKLTAGGSSGGSTSAVASGMAMGATHAETFTSIAGVGDLDVTCRSKYGRNRRFGQDIIKTDILKKFKNLDDLINRIGEIGYLSEGAVACKYVHEIAEKYGLHLVISGGLYKILNREIEPMDFLNNLLEMGKING